MVATTDSTASSAWRRLRPVVVTISSTNWERFNAPPMALGKLGSSYLSKVIIKYRPEHKVKYWQR